MVHPPNTRTLYPTNTESSRKTLLIIGSTSRQGRAVIKELVYSPSTRHSFRILGLTRNPHSEPALSLLQITEVFRGSCITFVQADLNDPKSVEQIFQNNEIWGVFLVGVGKTAREEERHCTLIADLAYIYQVRCFIYSSIERGGELYDDQPRPELNRTMVKVAVERHIRSMTAKGFRWIILRPGLFMEDLEGGQGKVTATILRQGLHPHSRIQLISLFDIGKITALLFKNPEGHINTIIVAIADSLTSRQLEATHELIVGKPIVYVPKIFAKFLLKTNREKRDFIATVERAHHYYYRTSKVGSCENAINDIKNIHPKIMTFEHWLIKRKIFANKMLLLPNQASPQKPINSTRRRVWNRRMTESCSS